MITGQRTNLPAQPTALIGRDSELAAARAELVAPGVRLLTLTGPPGTGKTRLALEVGLTLADSFADGVKFIDLSPVSEGALVLPAIAEPLGVREIGRRPLLDSVKDYLWSRRILLILDNFEQVLEAAPLVADLMASCPTIKVLVTSRASLRLRWEHEFPVPPLAVPDLERDASVESLLGIPSIALFVDRARARWPEFRLTDDNARAVAESCVRLDGLPLAIELAASRTRFLAPQALLARLETRLDLLASGPRDLPARHQTLRGAIGWSYSLLSSDERTLFRRLSVFVGGFDLEAAASICGSPSPLALDVSDGVSALVDNSLVRVDDLTRGRTRFRLLETLREYGIECVQTAREAETLKRRHADYFAAMVDASERGLAGAGQRQWLERLETEHANMIAALGSLIQHQEAALPSAMVGALWRFWWRRGHLTLGRQLVHQVLAMPGLEGRTLARARVLVSGGLLALWQADYEEAERLLVEAAGIARKVRAPSVEAYALTFLCRVARDQGGAAAITLGTDAVDLFRQFDDLWGLGVALHFLGLAVLDEDSAKAAGNFEESASIFRGLGTSWDLAMPTRGLGLAAYLEGDYARARVFFQESAGLFRSFGDEWSLAMVSHDLGYVARSQGRVMEAAAHLGDSLRGWRRLGNARGALTALAGLAGVAATAGRASDGARLLAAVSAIADRAGIVLEPTDQSTLQRILELTRARLSPEEFEQASGAGRATGLEEAIEEGLRLEKHVSIAIEKPATSAMSALTPRELEVASLLPLGLTNRQIGQALVISEGTAGLHVKHILGKLGFASRAQAAAWVIEQGVSAASEPRAAGLDAVF